MHIRPATIDDAAALHASALAGFAGYRSFAPPGWTPPDDPLQREVELLGRDDYHAFVVEDDGGYAGHAAWWPASATHRPDGDAGLAHLRHLFVVPAHWGTGLATRLLAGAVDDARAAGFTRMRLGTPQGQARARRFYEREGWTTDGVPLVEDRFGLAMVEYFRPL